MVKDADLELDGDVDAELLEEFGMDADCANEEEDSESEELCELGDEVEDEDKVSRVGDVEKVSIKSGGGANGSELSNNELLIFLL